jgi:nicotinamide-nucleotide amidase
MTTYISNIKNQLKTEILELRTKNLELLELEMLNISILTIGDEICIGQIVNTNSSWIASHCTETGANVILHSSIGDRRDLIMEELKRLMSKSDVVIITGGLGPTHDDITKPVLTEFFNDELVFHEESYEQLKKFFEKRGRQITDRNKEQAMLPSRCTPLSNAVGTAPGMRFESKGKYVFSLPGVPSEMKYIMTEHILPFIIDLMASKQSDVVLYKTLHTINIPESSLADLIGPPEEFLNGGTLAFLPSYKGVRLRIGVTGTYDSAQRHLEQIEQIIRERAGKYIYGEFEDSIAAAVGRLLKERGETLAVAESCTGGMLGGEITEISGSSDYFPGGAIVYSNEAKINIVGVKKETIDNHGAVSEETALELASNIRKLFNSSYGLSITGIAGPTGGTPEKPVGTVWIGLADENGATARKVVYSSDRRTNREYSVGAALGFLYERLTKRG